MPDKIKVMISSTIKDLLADRDAIQKCFLNFPFVELVGAEPIRERTSARSPFINTIDMAENADFFILILGSRYGYEIRAGTSATEAEFDAAYQSDPTKILVFQKEGDKPDEKQQTFIDKVGHYYKGYWITRYQYTHDLQTIVEDSFLSLLKERAAIGTKLTFFDHFVRIAKQRSPSPGIKNEYAVREDRIEFTYHFPNRDRIIHFDKQKVISDFWGCVAEIEHQFYKWKNE
jgi:hypothetical protein